MPPTMLQATMMPTTRSGQIRRWPAALPRTTLRSKTAPQGSAAVGIPTPAVLAPVPGGLTFAQARAVIHDLCRKGRVVGMDVVEITPSADVNHITSIVAGRLAMNLIGMGIRAGWFD